MSWTICFPLPKDSITIDGRHSICFLIPQLIDPNWPHFGPNPPDPPRFMNHPRLDREKTWHLQVLATIDEVAEKLPADLSRDIQRSVATHMQSLGQELGTGVELRRHTQKV